jgi:hypothetical protein
MNASQDDRDVVMVLTDEHREIQHMFGVLTDAGIGDARNFTALVDEVVIELARHFSATERCVHPALRRHAPGGDALADRQDAENAQVRHWMKAVTGREPSDAEFEPALAQLMAAVRTHIADEERDVFPKLAASCTPEQLRHMGTTAMAVERSAPTRPHPSAPHKPPMNAVTEPALGLIDKARDRLGHRGSEE